MLEPPNIPFPITTPFRTVADLYKLPSTLHGQTQEHYFQLDSNLENYLKVKLFELSQHPQYARCFLEDQSQALSKAMWQVFDLIAQDKPDLVQKGDDGVTLKALGITLDHQLELGQTSASLNNPDLIEDIYQHLSQQQGLNRLADTLAFAVQEDLVIMRETLKENGSKGDIAEALLVTMPSHWNPLEKLGLSFAQIHQPVADNAALLKAADNLMKAMFYKGPFVRFNWSVSKLPDLAQNPALLTTRPLHPLDDPQALLEKLYFRVERQTIIALVGQRSLFTIRIFSQSLAEALNSPEKRQRFCEGLASMSEAMLAYKGLGRYRDVLLTYLNQTQSY
ncbi:MAG: DUF3445 domain-containing protein [Deinococcales bacterium]